MDASELTRLIRERAYRIWVDEGRPEGRALHHWAQAKRELEEEAAITDSGQELKWE